MVCHNVGEYLQCAITVQQTGICTLLSLTFSLYLFSPLITFSRQQKFDYGSDSPVTISEYLGTYTPDYEFIHYQNVIFL